MTTAADLLAFNGIDGASGNYLLPPLTADDVARVARGEALDPDQLRELKRYHQRASEALGELLKHRRAQATRQHEH